MYLYRRRTLCLLAISLVGIAALATASPAAAADRPEVRKGADEQMVAMRDGVKLATNVFLPKGDGPWPVVLTRTPYSKDGQFGAMASRYTSAGYAYVIQDCRGMFRSEGEYRPFLDDQEDGFDTVNWIAEQAWCDGNVGMSGASAMGITSLVAASADPDALKAAIVVAAPESFWTEASFIGGVFKEADTTNWMRGQGAEDQVADRKASIEDTEEEASRDIASQRSKIDIPIYHLGGWYDIFSSGTQNNFTFLHNEGLEGARGNQKLFMGPFGHGNLAGELSYRNAGGILAVFAEELRWFDHHLKGEENGIGTEPPVKYYQMASARKGDSSEKNGWQTAENWPPESREVRYHLLPGGSLATEPSEDYEAATTYVHDPNNPVPTFGGANLTLPLGPVDQRQIEERDDYLRFQTPVLEEDVEIGGRVYVDLYASTDAPDTDFMVKLVDVYPDGYEALILDAPLRTRYREGREADQIKMMPAGEPVQMTVDLGSTANIFEAGHRIAVHVASSNAPRFEVNPGTGDPPGQPQAEPREANNTVYHNARQPTALVLPIVD